MDSLKPLKVKMLGVLGLITVITYIYFFKIGSYVNTESILLEESQIDDYYVRLTGNTSNSGLGYSGYRLIYKDHALYIKLRYSLVGPFNPKGEFLVEKGGYYEGITEVYFQGKNAEDIKLVWHE